MPRITEEQELSVAAFVARFDPTIQAFRARVDAALALNSPRTFYTLRGMLSEAETLDSEAQQIRACIADRHYAYPSDFADRELGNRYYSMQNSNLRADLNNRLLNSGQIPLGYGVQVWSESAANWFEGTISRVTAGSYFVSYRGYTGTSWRSRRNHEELTARVSKDRASSRLRLVRSPEEQAELLERQERERAHQEAVREARAIYDTQMRAYNDAVRAQAGLMEQAQQAALMRLIRIHAGLLHDFALEELTRLSDDPGVPGREVEKPELPEILGGRPRPSTSSGGITFTVVGEYAIAS